MGPQAHPTVRRAGLKSHKYATPWGLMMLLWIVLIFMRPCFIAKKPISQRRIFRSQSPSDLHTNLLDNRGRLTLGARSGLF